MIARVVLDSPLPSLDKVFDYQIEPEQIDAIAIGVRVLVPFGRNRKLQDAFVVDLIEASDFVGKLSSIAEVVSTVAAMPANIYSLVRAVADRQASTAGDVMASALVRRSVRVEKSFLAGRPDLQARSMVGHPEISAVLANPTLVSSEFSAEPQPDWIVQLLRKAQDTLQAGFSALIIVPDFRDQAALRKAIGSTVLKESYIDFSSEQTGSKRYSASLECLRSGNHLVVGSRSALYAPLQNLGLIAVFDDGDRNFQDQQSPYAHARDIALLRQVTDACSVLFVGHARSTDLQRLIELNYVSEVESKFAAPKLAFDDTTGRVSTLAWAAIREGVGVGCVLVQVSSKGIARTAYCQDCSKRALCSRCNGPIWIDSNSTPRCRWCNAQNLAFACSICKSSKLRQGYGGATRTVAEFGASFPGMQLIESTGDNPILEVSGHNKIVISTPGAEPSAVGGYSRVIILDAGHAINRDSLRASEDAIRDWSNAIAKLAPAGRAVIVGVANQLGSRLSLWQQRQLASDELNSRRELGFPPHLRLGSIEGPISTVSQLANEVALDGVQFLGPISMRSQSGEDQQRLVMKFTYSAGQELSLRLKAAQLRLTTGLTKTSDAGRVSRAIRVRMDDPEVI